MWISPLVAATNDVRVPTGFPALIGNRPARFGDHQYPGAHVPGGEVLLPSSRPASRRPPCTGRATPLPGGGCPCAAASTCRKRVVAYLGPLPPVVRKPGDDQGVSEVLCQADCDRGPVPPRFPRPATAVYSSPVVTINNHANGRAVIDPQRHRNAHPRESVDEIGRTVNRIYQPKPAPPSGRSPPLSSLTTGSSGQCRESTSRTACSDRWSTSVTGSESPLKKIAVGWCKAAVTTSAPARSRRYSHS